MASPSRKRSSSTGRQDRISYLTDDVLGHVLSFLPTKEAACAAALSRRWRYVFGRVHTISFEEAEGDRANDWTTWFYETLEHKSCSDELLDNIGAALLCRRRCAGFPVPLRSLRFTFDRWHRWDKVAVDQWLSYVLLPHTRAGDHPNLHLDLRFHLGAVCAYEQDFNAKHYMSDSFSVMWRYLLPRRLFSCSALRTLCVTYCRLKLRRKGMAIELPFLETMHLTALGDSGRSIRQLISSCPRLSDLTLEALWRLRTISVLDKRLRRFSLRCCHRLKSADIDASELRSLDYKGMVPWDSLLSLHDSPTIIPSCTIDFCMPLYNEAECVRFGDFLNKIPRVTHLHLLLVSLERKFLVLVGLPLFSYLTRLTVRGCITQGHNQIEAVRWILELTPNLEVLTLLLKKSDKVDDDIVEAPDYESSFSPDLEVHTLLLKKSDKLDEIAEVPDDESSFSIPCLQHRLREISMVNYEGVMPEKMLARLLLRNALVLERLSVVFADGLKSNKKNRLKVQMRKWGVANSEKVFTSVKRSSLI